MSEPDWADEIAAKLMDWHWHAGNRVSSANQNEVAAALRSAHRAGMVLGMREAATSVEPKTKVCDCVYEYEGLILYHCLCDNSGDTAMVADWCARANDAKRLRARADELEKQG